LYYYKKVIKRFEEINSSDFKGYEIFIPQTIKEWVKQAEVLNQCILRCGYINKVIKQKSLLIFVQKNGTPIATVEVNSNAEIKNMQMNLIEKIVSLRKKLKIS
jgi:hypothetical protein